MNKNRLLSILSEMKPVHCDIYRTADIIIKQINDDIWHNPDGTERYLTPEQYKDLRDEEWTGLCWVRDWAYGWTKWVPKFTAEHPTDDRQIVCAGNHGAPPDDWRS